MVYYIFIATFLYLLGLLEINYGRQSVKKRIAIVSAVILILFAGLKTAGVTDYLNYKDLYEFINEFNYSGQIELGYQFIMLICKQASFNFLLFYFIVACFSISLKISVFYRLSQYVIPALLIYFCGCFFERDNDGIRQGLSMAFCFVALYYLLKEKNTYFFIWTICAILVHYSSVTFLGLFLLKKIHWSNKTVFIILCGAYACSILGIYLTNYLTSNVFIAVAAAKIDRYSQNEYSEEMGITIGILFRTFILCLFMISRHKMQINNTLFYTLRNGLAFAITLSLVLGNFIILAHRLPYVFREFQILIVPFLVGLLPRKLRVLGLTVIYIYACIILSRYFAPNSIYNEYQNLLL